MAASAKSFVTTQTNSRYAETLVPSSEKLKRISEELELRKLSNNMEVFVTQYLYNPVFTLYYAEHLPIQEPRIGRSLKLEVQVPESRRKELQ